MKTVYEDLGQTLTKQDKKNTSDIRRSGGEDRLIVIGII